MKPSHPLLSCCGNQILNKPDPNYPGVPELPHEPYNPNLPPGLRRAIPISTHAYADPGGGGLVEMFRGKPTIFGLEWWKFLLLVIGLYLIFKGGR